LTIPADTFVIGHKQKMPQLNIMLAGHIILTNEDGTRTELVAPQVFVGPPGRKIAYAVETVIWQNIYPTTETDVATLEATYLDKSYSWQIAQRDQQMLLSFSHAEDIADFHLAIAEYGLDPDTVRRISEDPSDQIPFPVGSYKVMVGPSPIEGKGLFATAAIAEGEMIAPGRLDGMRTPAGRYTNHSKRPNAVAALADNGDIHLFATCDIVGCKGGDLGDEITLDYRQGLSLASRRD
jgi:hypothetical protein